MWRENCRRKLSDLTYPPYGFNLYDNNINGDNSNTDTDNKTYNGNTDNKNKNIDNGNMYCCNNNVQCVINQATNDTKIKPADNMWESLLQSFRLFFVQYFSFEFPG